MQTRVDIFFKQAGRRIRIALMEERPRKIVDMLRKILGEDSQPLVQQ
jgi:hypothetical protein